MGVEDQCEPDDDNVRAADDGAVGHHRGERRSAGDPRGEAETLSPVLRSSAAELQDKLSKDAGFVYLARKVNDDVSGKVKSLALPGISLLPEPQRFLPEGDLALPVLGMVGLDGNGLAGLELQYDHTLSGHPGRLVVERDPRGADIPGGLRRLEPPARGSDCR